MYFLRIIYEFCKFFNVISLQSYLISCFVQLLCITIVFHKFSQTCNKFATTMDNDNILDNNFPL